MKRIALPWPFTSVSFALAFLLGPLVFVTSEDCRAIYQSKTGTTIVRIEEVLQITPTYILNKIERSNGSLSSLFLNSDYATQRWQYEDIKQGTKLTAQRRENQILVEGTFQGKPVQKIYRIDNSPWYQSWNRDFQQFVLSGKNRQEFWSIQENDLSIYKMVAIREKEEKVSVGNQTVDTIKVTVTLTNWMALFWKVHFWFRKTDGQFIRYEGVQGPPGSPQTVIELVEETFYTDRDR